MKGFDMHRDEDWQNLKQMTWNINNFFLCYFFVENTLLLYVFYKRYNIYVHIS